MENVEFLLSDEYVKFSQRITELHALKKALKEEFKKKYDEYQKSLAGLDEEANSAQSVYETWKATQQNKKKTERAEKETK